MQDGTVLWFNDVSGTGKILGDDGAMVTVSYKALRGEGYRALDEGQRVCFEAVKQKSGLEAYFVVSVFDGAMAEAAAS